MRVTMVWAASAAGVCFCAHPNTWMSASMHSPGCIDPDYIQVTEVVTLGVHQTAAGTALGPRSVWWKAVSSLHVRMFLHWKSQSWSETSRNRTMHRHQTQQLKEQKQHFRCLIRWSNSLCFLGVHRRAPAFSINAVVFDSREQHKALGVSFCCWHTLFCHSQALITYAHLMSPKFCGYKSQKQTLPPWGKCSPSCMEAQRVMRRSMLVLEDMLAAEGWSSADMDSHALCSVCCCCVCLQVPPCFSLLSPPRVTPQRKLRPHGSRPRDSM